jgi:hypothetical protein
VGVEEGNSLPSLYKVIFSPALANERALGLAVQTLDCRLGSRKYSNHFHPTLHNRRLVSRNLPKVSCRVSSLGYAADEYPIASRSLLAIVAEDFATRTCFVALPCAIV